MEKVETIALDRALHDPVRTRIMQILYTSHATTFNDLRRVLKDVNEGTNSRQIYKLQKEGYGRIKKPSSKENPTPNTSSPRKEKTPSKPT